MDKTVYINMHGKNYPMRFSLGASVRISEKYGSLNGMLDAMQEENDKERFEALIDIAEILIRQGCAYKNLFEKELPVPDDAPVTDGEYVPLSREEISVSVAAVDIGELKLKIMQTVVGGNTKKISVKERGTPKNAEAT